MLLNQDGSVASRQYYHPFGDNRNGPFSTLTTKRFTGQYHEEALGLYFYGARWYDPLLGRFTQADTLIPDPAAPQAFNRYAYTLNNPLRFTDPSGHRYEPCGPGGADCGGGGGGGGGNGGGGHGGGGGGHHGGGRGKGSHPHQGYKWSWTAPPGYEDWYASAKYGGCFKCHAVHFSHLTALTNQELANVDERMRRLYYIAVKDSAMSGIILLSLLEGMPTGEAAIDEAEAALAEGPSEILLEDEIVLSGHGSYELGSGTFTVPDGTSVVTYSKFGGSITDRLGNAIEEGAISENTYFKVWESGQKMPDYTLHPPGELTITGNPLTVQTPTKLSSLLSQGMGRVHWAACTYTANTKWSDQVWDVEGVWYDHLPK